MKDFTLNTECDGVDMNVKGNPINQMLFSLLAKDTKKKERKKKKRMYGEFSEDI